MCKFSLKLPFLLLLVCCLIACSLANNKPSQIYFSPDSTKIIFADIDPAGLLKIRNTPGIDTAFTEIMSVLETPGENDSIGREQAITGRIQVMDSIIVFSPTRPFVRGKDYIVISYINSKFADVATLLKGKDHRGVEPHQVTLSR